jgi:hypothetical protein
MLHCFQQMQPKPNGNHQLEQIKLRGQKVKKSVYVSHVGKPAVRMLASIIRCTFVCQDVIVSGLPSLEREALIRPAVLLKTLITERSSSFSSMTMCSVQRTLAESLRVLKLPY